MKITKHIKKTGAYLSYSLIGALFLGAIIFSYNSKIGNTDEARSATFHTFYGQAWSDTIGWLSFNCSDGGPSGSNICGTSNYSVSTDGLGYLKGQAWSDNVGWVRFDATTSCPTAPCQGQLVAGGLTGWARAIAPYIPIDPDPQRGGWDGWIDLSTVTRSGNDITGAAWGDINVGWLSMNCVNGGVSMSNICGVSNYKVYVTPTIIPDPTLTFNVTPNTLAPGGSSSMSWTATNVDTCVASGDWSGSRPLNGSGSTGILSIVKTYTYTLTCTNTTYNLSIDATRLVAVTGSEFCGNGSCGVGETTTSCPADCTTVVGDFTANPKVVKKGGNGELRWTVVGCQNCRIFDESNNLVATIPNGNQTGTLTINNITQKQTYRLTSDGGLNAYATFSTYILFEY